jgi:hypothetical protein
MQPDSALAAVTGVGSQPDVPRYRLPHVLPVQQKPKMAPTVAISMLGGPARRRRRQWRPPEIGVGAKK